MSNLYKELSGVYEAMYQTFINYKDETDFYSRILKQNKCSSVIETGCGTGNLAMPLTRKGFKYLGLDISTDMLQLAREKNPANDFMQADIRNFKLAQKWQSCIITGRTISYLLTNRDIISAFSSIHKNLRKNGILCFDFIDALRFVPGIITKKTIEHRAMYNNVQYLRRSFWQADIAQNWLFKWQAIFYQENQNGRRKKIGEDNSLLRTFTCDEIEVFLRLSGFRVKEFINRPTYAFDTFVAVAEKI